MKKFLFFIIPSFILLLLNNVHASVSVCSWNLMNFGKSKTEKTLDFIATTLQPFDFIAIQEVLASDGGAQALTKMVDLMNRKGNSWDYVISNPTYSVTDYISERYAFIWDKSEITKTGNAWLEKKYNIKIEREPLMTTFKKEGKVFTIASYHAITKSSNPETEIKYFKYFPLEYPLLNLIICGDFNCPQSNSVFNPIKSMGYSTAVKNQKTTLRDRCLSGDCLASEYDNFISNKVKIEMIKGNIIHYYRSFQTFREAKQVSDHVPVTFTFEIE